MLELRNVVKKQGNKLTINGLDAYFSDDRVYGVVTPGLAEKDPLVGIMTGCEEINGGQIFINSVNLLSDPLHAKKRFGYLPFETPLYPDMTVYEFLSYIGSLKGLSGVELVSSVCNCLDKFGIEQYKNIMIKRLVAENKQLVGLAQAFLGSPKYILLDEPLHNLTPLKVMFVRDIIINKRESSTIIIFSNNLNEIARLCDEVLFVFNGKKVVMGGSDELVKYLDSTPEAINAVFTKADYIGESEYGESATLEVSEDEITNRTSAAAEWGTPEAATLDAGAQTAPEEEQPIAESTQADTASQYSNLSFEELMERVIVKLYTQSSDDDDELADDADVDEKLLAEAEAAANEEPAEYAEIAESVEPEAESDEAESAENTEEVNDNESNL